MKKFPSYLLIGLTILALIFSFIPTPIINQPNYIEFYDKDNNLIKSEIENKEGEYIYLDQLSDYTKNAFIAFEDKNFYNHHGFDSLRIIRSFFKNIFTLSFKEGASTITQQYARTIFLSNKKTLSRKIKEAYYTIKLEKKYTKDQILEGYLNTIYLGHGCYGIDAASRYYFNKSSKDLTLEEAATLAALPSSPSASSPFIDYSKSLQRRALVLSAMKQEGYITLFQYKDAINKQINLNLDHYKETNIAYYLDLVKEEITKKKINLNRGLKVYTNLDTTIYAAITSIINKHSFNSNQLSLVILENGSNKILANIGGVDYNTSNYNRSINSKRPIGSTIKTFLYSLALENNFSTKTALVSEKTNFLIKDYGEYSPSNSNNIYANKPITMEEAYAVSDNIYAVKTLLLLGGENFKQYLSHFNLIAQEDVPSLALGTAEFSLDNLVKAYSVYANNGYYYNYSLINQITDSFNYPLYTNKKTKKQIVNKTIVNKIQYLMSLPFINNNYYTKSTLQNYGITGYYGKSGSTSSDSYLIAFNDKYTIGIWMGTDDNSPLYDYTTVKYFLRDLIELI